MREFPGGPVVKSPPSNAGNMGSVPSQGTKILQPRGMAKKIKNKAKCYTETPQNALSPMPFVFVSFFILLPRMQM